MSRPTLFLNRKQSVTVRTTLFNRDEINRIAKRLRVQRVMQTYLETVVL